MRRIFADTLTELALKDPRIILVVGDFSYMFFEPLKAQRPKQYLNAGVCEQSMVSMASGMAIGGLIPVVYAITPFISDRACEQVKLDIDAQNVKVILAGFAQYPHLAPTHQEHPLETISTLWKNIHTYFPVTVADAKEAVLSAVARPGPSFIRLRNAPRP